MPGLQTVDSASANGSAYSRARWSLRGRSRSRSWRILGVRHDSDGRKTGSSDRSKNQNWPGLGNGEREVSKCHVLTKVFVFASIVWIRPYRTTGQLAQPLPAWQPK